MVEVDGRVPAAAGGFASSTSASPASEAACVEAVSSLGFECRPKMGRFADAVLAIEGMTCQSCVRNIEATVGRHPGVKFVRVQLEQKLGYVRYDADVTTSENVRLAIDDMGFEATFLGPSLEFAKQPVATLVTTMGDGKSAETSEAATCFIHIEGMTCMSCVCHIESTVGALAGVKAISVSLEKKEATVQYDRVLVTPEKLREHIDDMGYEATLPGAGGGTELEGFDELARIRGGGKSGGDVPSPNHVSGVPSVAIKSSSSAVSLGQSVLRLKITGMTCHSCVKLITTTFKEVPGVVNTDVTIGEGTFTYVPETITPNEIMATIAGLGFSANVALATSVTPQHKYRIDLSVSGLHSSTCARSVEDHLARVPGVITARVSLIEELATVTHSDDLRNVDDLVAAVKAAGPFTARIKRE